MNSATVIENASIIDGTGASAFRGAVRIEGDRIAAVARQGEPLRRDGAVIVDAAGLTLAPGFIDAHTHYDAQVLWDKLVDPVALHGATTVVTGCCSFTLAPANERTRDVIRSLFHRAEDLRLDRFSEQVDFTWNSFGDYLDRIRDGLGVNVSPLIGHTPIRHTVMGEDAQQRVATDAEISEMCAILREALEAGASGLSMAFIDTDENNVPIATVWADERERMALARVLADHGRGVLQSNLGLGSKTTPFEELEQFGRISIETGVHVEAIGAFASSENDTFLDDLLKKVEDLQARGADVVLQTTSKTFDQFLQFDANFFYFFLLPVWQDLMVRPVSERIAWLSDRGKRADLLKVLEDRGDLPMFLGAEIIEAQAASVRALEGKLVKDIAKERGVEFFDALLDIALEDDLRTVFALRGILNADIPGVTKILRHPHTRPASGSDGGAHLYQFATSGDSTWFLQRWVRELGIMPLEEAVRRLTSVPAKEFNLADRGIVAAGRFADLVLFDPAKIALGPVERPADLPDGSARYRTVAEGIATVWVNGRIVVQDGAYTDARAGRLV